MAVVDSLSAPFVGHCPVQYILLNTLTTVIFCWTLGPLSCILLDTAHSQVYFVGQWPHSHFFGPRPQSGLFSWMLPIIRYSDTPMKSQVRSEPIYCYLDFCVVRIYLLLGFQRRICTRAGTQAIYLTCSMRLRNTQPLSGTLPLRITRSICSKSKPTNLRCVAAVKIATVNSSKCEDVAGSGGVAVCC